MIVRIWRSVSDAGQAVLLGADRLVRPVGEGDGGPRTVLGGGADDRRHHEERRVGMALAHGVEEAVERRGEGPQAEGVAVDDVDADLQADAVGRRVADRAGRELVEVALAGEAEVGEVHAGEPGGHGRPRPRRAVRLHAVADRAAVVHPDTCGCARALRPRAVGHPQRTQTGSRRTAATRSRPARMASAVAPGSRS